MSFPDKCPNCDAVPKAYQERSDVRVYKCGTWIIENTYSKGPHTQKSGTCNDWRKIKDATAVIRAFLEGDRDAREKGFNWIAENSP